MNFFSSIMPSLDYDGLNTSFSSIFLSFFTLLVIGFGDNCYKIILAIVR